MQKVSVQVGELLAGADLLQVVGGDNEEVTKGVECVEELQHQRDLEDIQTHSIIYITPLTGYTRLFPVDIQGCHDKYLTLKTTVKFGQTANWK